MARDVVVRRIEKRDLETVCEMHSELYTLFSREGDVGLSPRRLYASSRSLNPKSPLEYLVAEVDDRVVGYVNFNIPGPLSNMPIKDCLYIGGLYVKPEYRRRGVGTALIREVIRQGEKNKDTWSVIRILTNAGNKEFYEALGFMPMKNPQTETAPMWSHEYHL